MQTVTVPVIAAFEHQGRSLQAGDTVTVAPVEAAALSRAGKVSIVGGYQHKALQPETDPTPRRRLRKDGTPTRRYKRRDLVPEK